MKKEEFFKKLTKDFNVTEKTINIIEEYKSFLQEKNKIHNLTRLDSEDKIYGEYFYDSIIPYKDLNWINIKNVLDVGSGSGIPGVLLKILFPHIELTIVESVGKKVNFMKELTEKLNLTNVHFINGRAENINNKYKNTFDLVTARAVAELYILLELLIPYMKDNGICVIPKGKKIADELQNATWITKKLKIELFKKEEYISSLGYKEYVLIYKKNFKTPSIYPRKWNSIINNKNKK